MVEGCITLVVIKMAAFTSFIIRKLGVINGVKVCETPWMHFLVLILEVVWWECLLRLNFAIVSECVGD